MFESQHLTGKLPCCIHTSINVIYHELILALSPIVLSKRSGWQRCGMNAKKNSSFIHGKSWDQVLLCFIRAIHCTSVIGPSFVWLSTRATKAMEHLMSVRLIRLRSLLVLNKLFLWHLENDTEFGSPPGSGKWGSCLEQEMQWNGHGPFPVLQQNPCMARAAPAAEQAIILEGKCGRYGHQE